ncbi:MAG: putative thioredoxin domain-containing protein 5 [Terrestrivirus sp.]|uniref:Putative thioredoxin domain-containing protein 5 n=1 Tax=Terrestrivirus sp. TaxID=2487775 RepID=A0A3G4ZQR5_9VIRU|nr:MAG: putative thioredoxin domain-containing protein 5 [Terrestrivirus sp.]
MQNDYVNKTTIIVGILAIIILILLIMNYQKTNQINALKPTESMQTVGGYRPQPRPVHIQPVPPVQINTPVRSAEIVLYYAEWCGHCKNFMPVWQQFEKRNKNKITIKTVNCDENKSLCSKMDIQGFPTVRLYKSSREVVNFDGNRSVEGLEQFINQYI